MQTSRKNPPLPGRFEQIQLLTDLSSTTMLKRKTFAPITAALWVTTIPFKWGFPDKLLVKRNGTDLQSQLRDLELAKTTLMLQEMKHSFFASSNRAEAKLASQLKKRSVASRIAYLKNARGVKVLDPQHVANEFAEYYII
ncbi:Hypothetical predicted protein [Pelobates cultripes]|uniref:Uncharacterized protein n=1 Tax=Pelobates cultripes TaxID=61616 RepID=A0AAD1RG90_PELCU|nr:Hypothetical predicted protein [Pelobates cultripes]